jgi:hypothetical protein
MNKKEKQPPQVINLAGDLKDSATEIIKVGRRRYKVEKAALDASPLDFIEGWRDECLRPLYCLICGFELGHPEDFSAYMGPEDCRCIVHCQQDGGRRTAPCCVYCGTRMEVVLPFEVPLHSLRYLWICPDRHCHLVSDCLEGIQ